jgi:hypothetical protein
MKTKWGSCNRQTGHIWFTWSSPFSSTTTTRGYAPQPARVPQQNPKSGALAGQAPGDSSS